MRAPSDEVADGTVLQEFRRGFKIGGQLLRPAMVQVRSPRHTGLQAPRKAVNPGWSSFRHSAFTAVELYHLQ